MDWRWICGTYVALLVVERFVGLWPAMWLASILLTWCVGVMYGAGTEIEKRIDHPSDIG